MLVMMVLMMLMMLMRVNVTDNTAIHCRNDNDNVTAAIMMECAAANILRRYRAACVINISANKKPPSSSALYLNVTRFLIRLPRSENPRCIGGRRCTAGWSKVFVIGEFGSENCLSTRIGFGCKRRRTIIINIRRVN